MLENWMPRQTSGVNTVPQSIPLPDAQSQGTRLLTTTVL